MSKQIHIYSSGIVHCSVCAPKEMDRKDIEKEVNRQNPTGIQSEWSIDTENFADGSKNPKVCEQDEERVHYLMSC